jgi:hypothetical protein
MIPGVFVLFIATNMKNPILGIILAVLCSVQIHKLNDTIDKWMVLILILLFVLTMIDYLLFK